MLGPGESCLSEISSNSIARWEPRWQRGAVRPRGAVAAEDTGRGLASLGPGGGFSSCPRCSARPELLQDFNPLSGNAALSPAQRSPRLPKPQRRGGPGVPSPSGWRLEPPGSPHSLSPSEKRGARGTPRGNEDTGPWGHDPVREACGDAVTSPHLNPHPQPPGKAPVWGRERSEGVNQHGGGKHGGGFSIPTLGTEIRQSLHLPDPSLLASTSPASPPAQSSPFCPQGRKANEPEAPFCIFRSCSSLKTKQTRLGEAWGACFRLPPLFASKASRCSRCAALHEQGASGGEKPQVRRAGLKTAHKAPPVLQTLLMGGGKYSL